MMSYFRVGLSEWKWPMNLFTRSDDLIREYRGKILNILVDCYQFYGESIQIQKSFF